MPMKIKDNVSSHTDLYFTDPQGKVSYVPIALCRTWFGLVKHIVGDCIDEEFDLMNERIEYDLLNEGSAFRLITKEELPVTMESWLQLVKEDWSITGQACGSPGKAPKSCGHLP